MDKDMFYWVVQKGTKIFLGKFVRYIHRHPWEGASSYRFLINGVSGYEVDVEDVFDIFPRTSKANPRWAKIFTKSGKYMYRCIVHSGENEEGDERAFIYNEPNTLASKGYIYESQINELTLMPQFEEKKTYSVDGSFAKYYYQNDKGEYLFFEEGTHRAIKVPLERRHAIKEVEEDTNMGLTTNKEYWVIKTNGTAILGKFKDLVRRDCLQYILEINGAIINIPAYQIEDFCDAKEIVALVDKYDHIDKRISFIHRGVAVKGRLLHQGTPLYKTPGILIYADENDYHAVKWVKICYVENYKLTSAESKHDIYKVIFEDDSVAVYRDGEVISQEVDGDAYIVTKGNKVVDRLKNVDTIIVVRYK